MTKTCKWTLDYNGEETVWQTDCDHAWISVDGTPIENEMVYCPMCGKKLEQVTPKEEEDDECNKINSQILALEIKPDLRFQYGEVVGTKIKVDIWDDGGVVIYDADNQVGINASALAEIVKAIKIFRKKRGLPINGGKGILE